MKKVLIISSSARKNGNSDLLCDEFMRGATEAGHQVEKIRLADYNIQYCTGCAACHTNHKCVIKDDMEQLLEKMLQADTIVLASPVYFYSMNAQMKTFIDRCDSKYTQISNKEFYFIISAADTDQSMMEKVIEAFRGFTRDCLDNAQEKGIVYGLGAWEPGSIKSSPAMQQAYEMGKKV